MLFDVVQQLIIVLKLSAKTAKCQMTDACPPFFGYEQYIQFTSLKRCLKYCHSSLTLTIFLSFSRLPKHILKPLLSSLFKENLNFFGLIFNENFAWILVWVLSSHFLTYEIFYLFYRRSMLPCKASKWGCLLLHVSLYSMSFSMPCIGDCSKNTDFSVFCFFENIFTKVCIYKY